MTDTPPSQLESLPDVKLNLVRCAAVFALIALSSAAMEEPFMTEAIAAPVHQATQLASAIAIPETFREVSSRQVSVDGIPATLTRHEPSDGDDIGLGGEHVSMLRAENGRLKGFVRLQRSLADGALPSEQSARQVAMRFLQRAAPDLLDSMEVHWVAPHDETISIRQGSKRTRITIPGMKVKIRNTSDGRWFWVIVGTDGAPIVFERDIVWITMPGHRQTEKWLHDSWLAKERTG